MRINEYLFEFLSIVRTCVETKDYSQKTIECLKGFTPFFENEIKIYIETILNKINEDELSNKENFDDIIKYCNEKISNKF
jgi:hypothetical protein